MDNELLDVLIEARKRTEHNLCCYSKTYTMFTPKEGFETQHKQASDDFDKINRLIEKYSLIKS